MDAVEQPQGSWYEGERERRELERLRSELRERWKKGKKEGMLVDGKN